MHTRPKTGPNFALKCGLAPVGKVHQLPLDKLYDARV